MEVDMALDFHDISKRLLGELKRLAPHGPGNEKPLFLTRNVYDYGTSKVVGRHQEHIKLELVDSKSAVVMNGIAFGQSAAAHYIKSKRSFDIIYTIEENSYKRGEIQLQIEDIKPSE
jgi:single-stranded-DNA-specific exonuclease